MIELGHVTDRKPPFRYAAYQRVGFSETDAQGVVYYGRYMPYFDLARTEFHRHLGRVHLGAADFAMRASVVEYHRHLGRPHLDNVDFAMRALTIEYVAPARFDDLLEIFVRVERIGTTSITYDHAAYRLADDEDGGTANEVLMATAKQTLVLIDLGRRRPVSVPEAFRERIAEFQREQV